MDDFVREHFHFCPLPTIRMIDADAAATVLGDSMTADIVKRRVQTLRKNGTW